MLRLTFFPEVVSASKTAEKVTAIGLTLNRGVVATFTVTGTWRTEPEAGVNTTAPEQVSGVLKPKGW